MELPYDPEFPLLGIYSKNMKRGYQRDSHTPKFIAALLTIAKTGKQPKYPSMDKEDVMYWQVKNFLWVFPQDVTEKSEHTFCPTQHTHTHTLTHTHEYYSTMRKKEILPFVTTQLSPEELDQMK